MVFALLASAFGQAPAGGGFDAHGFRLAAHDADARDPLVVNRPGPFDAQTWFLSGLLEYASQPLVFAESSGDVVHLDDLVAANLAAGYAPHERVRVNLVAPLYFHARGVDGPLGAGFGDLRATALVSLMRSRPGEETTGLGLFFDLDLPTGRPEAWLGQWSVAGGIGMAATWEVGRATLTASASSQLRPNTVPAERPAPTRGGDAFAGGLAVGYLVTPSTGLNVEAHVEIPTDEGVFEAIGAPVEALVSVKSVRGGGGFLTAGVGTGLTRGAGASPLRLVLGGGFGETNPWKDTDGDAIGDDEDACVTEPETRNGFRDDDGCPDVPPILTIRAVMPDGELATDARITATGPEAWKTDGEAPGVARGEGVLILQGPGVEPGATWSAVADLGACQAGRAQGEVGETGGSLDVRLEPRLTGRVRLEASGPDGAPLPGAQLALRSEDPACAGAPAATGADGAAEVAAGTGKFFAFVTAPGYALQRQSFDLAAGDSIVLRVQLQPTRIRVEANDIVILEKVFFDTGKTTIQPRSFPLLDEVAEAIAANDLKRVEIQGHTDDRGKESSNQVLSQGRAEAVRDYLVSKGVPAAVLVPRGYGEGSPIADNKTEAGRSENRRVQFKILPPE